MKRTLLISLILSSLPASVYADTQESLSVENTFVMLEDKDAQLSESKKWFSHNIGTLETGALGGTLNIMYDGYNEKAKSLISLSHINGTGNLVLEGSSTNTMKLFRLAENATEQFYGNLTLCNYSAAWDGAGLYDNVTLLEVGATTLAGSITLDVAGYCLPDTFFVAGLGLNGDLTTSGVDAADYIAPAAVLYSGSIKEDATSIEHAKELSYYITPEEHVLTINTGGEHHFHGSLLGGFTIIKKGSGTQSFTGNLGTGMKFQALGGILNLNSHTNAAEITVSGATLNNTGNLTTTSLNMQDGQLSVSGTLSSDSAEFHGNNTLNSGSIQAGTWVFNLQNEHREQALLSLECTGSGTIQTLSVDYDATQLLRGWYQLIQNYGTLNIDSVTTSTGETATTKEENNTLYYYVENGTLTLPRTDAAELTWLPTSGIWQTNTGHAEMLWSGPEFNSNFQSGDRVCFNQAAEITLVGELLPAHIQVNNTTGTLTFSGTGCIGGSGSLTKSSTGTLNITAAHTFTGGCTIEEGTLITSHAGALGSGQIILKGGQLNLAGQSVQNTICIQESAEIYGGSQYAGELQMQGGTLRGEAICLQRTAQLSGGEIATEFTGSGGINIQGNVQLSAAGTYTGSTSIHSGTLTIGHAQAMGTGEVHLKGGTLDLAHYAAANNLHVQGTGTLLHAGQFNGSIYLQSGSLTTDSLGNALIHCSGNATLKADGTTVNVTSGIINTGNLTLEGTFNLTPLANSLQSQMVDAYGNVGGSSGFQQDSGTNIALTTGGGTLGGSATFLFLGQEISLDSQGHCFIGASTHYSQYHISSGHQVEVSAIRKVAGEKLNIITMSGGTLLADADATVTAQDAIILQTAGTLNATCTDSTITTAGGAIQITFNGDNQLIASAPVEIRNLISNTGNLTIQGEFDASSLPLTEQAATRIGGTSAASGFSHTAGYSVQIISGGSNTAGAIITHGSHKLTLSTDGWAYSGGVTDYSEYLLTGTDTARLSEIQRPELQHIKMTGGTFTVDSDTDTLQATGGRIILESGTISSTISGSAQLEVTGTGRLTGTNTHTGGTTLNNGHLTITSAEALGTGEFSTTGISSLTTEGFTLQLTNPIQNDGHLLLHGDYDATALLQIIGSDMIDAYGNTGGTSGFLQDAGSELQLISGGTINTAGASIWLRDKRVTPDETGRISLPGTLHLDTYYVTGTHSVRVSDIRQVAGDALQQIHMDSGTLQVDESTNTLSASGGLVQISNAHLGGSISGSTQIEVLGDAVLNSANTHSGGTTVTSGSLRITHAQALGTGTVHLNGNNTTLNLSDLSVSNELRLSGTSNLAGLENFSGAITMDSGAETTIMEGSVLNIRSGQTLTVSPEGNTIHGHVNLDGGTIVFTGGPLTLNGVANFSNSITLDLSQLDNLDSEVIILDFPSVYDDELVSIVLPEHLTDENLIFDPETGKIIVEATPEDEAGDKDTLVPTLVGKLNRNQRAAYKTLCRLDTKQLTGELQHLAEKTQTATKASEIARLMDRVHGAGYTATLNSIMDDALAHMQQVRNTAGTAHQLRPEHKTAVLIHAYNHNGSTSGNPQNYDRNAWGGRLMVEQQVDSRLCLGLALANGQTKITPEEDATHEDTATHLQAYALYTDNDWRFLLAAGIGMHEFSLSRHTHSGSESSVEGVSGQVLQFCAELSRRIPLGQSSSLHPFVAFHSTAAEMDAFCESGSTAALQVDEQQASLTELNLGMRYECTLADWCMLGFHAALTATQGDTETELDLRFAGAPAEGFRVYSGERDALGGRFGASLQFAISPSCTLHAASAIQWQSSASYLDSQVGITLHF